MSDGNKRFFELLLGSAKVVLGGAFVIEGIRAISGKGEPQDLLGDLGQQMQDYRNLPSSPLLPPAQPPSGKVINKAKTYRVGSIDERVGHIRRLIQKGSESPRIKEAIARILGRRCGKEWCVPPKNHVAEVNALFNAVHDPRSPYALRYTRDHVRVDQFSSVDDLMKLKVGDCDDGAIMLGSLLTAAGYPSKLRVIQAKGAPSWSHIYNLAGVPPGKPTRWIPLDWSVSHPAGWEVDGASEAAQFGSPSGLVEKVKDFPIY